MARRKGLGFEGYGCLVLLWVLATVVIADTIGTDPAATFWVASIALVVVIGLVVRWWVLERRKDEAALYGYRAAQRAVRGRSPLPSRLRFSVLVRDNYTCRYCGRSSQQQGVKLHVDHIVPVSRGGQDSLDNLVTACEECNLGKSDTMFDVSRS